LSLFFDYAPGRQAAANLLGHLAPPQNKQAEIFVLGMNKAERISGMKSDCVSSPAVSISFSRSRPEYGLLGVFAYRPISSLFSENQCSQVSRDSDISYMAVLGFLKMPILRQAPSF